MKGELIRWMKGEPPTKLITNCPLIQSNLFDWLKGRLFNSLHSSINSTKQTKVNFYFNLIEFNWFICELIEWNWIKIYYNSMLKVISWYKLNHKWKTTWIWWKLAGMKWYEFMNGMTFKPRKNEINKQIQFFSLRMGRIDLCWWSGRSSGRKRNMKRLNLKNENENLFNEAAAVVIDVGLVCVCGFLVG